MSAFIFFHLLNHDSTADIFWRESAQMAIEVSLDLFLCFFKKAKTPAVSGQTGYSADNERPGVPKRIQ
jgi:hypothetical protein